MDTAKLVRGGIGASALIAFAALLWFATRPPPLIVQGEVSSDRVDVSARSSGRVAALHADVGDVVEKGAVIAMLDNPQLAASLKLSEAALAVAEANFADVENVRPEDVDAAEAALAAADADIALFENDFERQAALVKRGDASRARFDQARRDLESARRKRDAAAAQLELTRQGASAERRAVAAARIVEARAELGRREADIAELTIRAPIAAQVTTRTAMLGENFSIGAPLFSMVDMSDLWFTFNLREDLLGGLQVGDQFAVDIPAIGASAAPVRVTVINVQGQFATWRATRATGDFDLRTFEVRARPVAPLSGLRPGMSVVARWR